MAINKDFDKNFAYDEVVKEFEMEVENGRIARYDEDLNVWKCGVNIVKGPGFCPKVEEPAVELEQMETLLDVEL